MKIFFKNTDGRFISIFVESTDTVLDVKRKIKEKLNINLDLEYFKIQYDGKFLDDKNATVEDCKIVKDSTVHLKLARPPPDYDARVKPTLKADLEAIRNEEKILIFIGLGCYDHNHGTASIKQQQCPDELFQVCREKNWKLRILLIDPDFPDTTPELQIYDIDKGWKPKIDADLNDDPELVCRYQYGDEDFWLSTYKSNVPNGVYEGHETTLIDIDMYAVAPKEGCVIMGNFFKSKKKPNVCYGNPEVLRELGYK